MNPIDRNMEDRGIILPYSYGEIGIRFINKI